jgi:preprotein translocase SecE subunit
MADEKKNVSTEQVEKKSKKSDVKKENIFVRIWKKIVKLTKDTVGELKKVVWTPKSEVLKSFKLVIATVLGVSLVIAIIDFGSSWIINTIASLIG